MSSARASGAQGARWEEPRCSLAMHRLFSAWLRPWVRRHFTAVRLDRDSDLGPLTSPRLVICANHPSWWDPITCMLLSGHCLPGRLGWWPMDAAQLERYGLFRRLGAFGVEPGTRRGAVAFLRAAEAARDRGVVLWLTGEGHFRDPRERPVRLMNGVGALAARSQDLVIVPLALELTFWNERLPEMLARFGSPVRVADGSARSADEWTREVENALTREMDALAARSSARDPRSFESILEGRRGVGGIYDLWRRARAAIAGREFEAAHESHAAEKRP